MSANQGLLGYSFQPATQVQWQYVSPESYSSNPTFFQKFGVNGPIGTAPDIGNDSSSWDWLGGNGILPTAFQGLQALGGLANAYTGLQQLQLARDQFDFSKNVANANLNNSVENYYNAIKNANRVGYALQGGYARKAYGANSQEAAATNAADEATKNLTRHV